MQTRNLIAGAWASADSGAEFDVRNPATDEVIARVPDCGAAETAQAIDAAAGALPEWRSRTAAERARPLRRLADLMHRDQERLARLMTAEGGKPLAEARGEVAYSASFIEWAAEEGKRLYGDVVPASAPDKRILAVRQPIGVTASITPWNFPSAMIGRKLGPSLACGNTIVIKPAEHTPLSAIAMGELAIEAGIPAGVLNVVTGDAATIGDELLGNPAVRKISFTGSTEVGKILMKKAADGIKRITLELGGHAPFIVFDDADVDAAVAGAMASKFRNMGQTCICANRIFVQGGVYDEFMGKLQRAIEDLKVGPGDEEGVQVGPLIDDDAVEKVCAHVDDARARGAEVRTGGRLVKPREGLTNRFYAPTLIDGFTGEMLVSHEETFGPVAPVRRFRDEREAVEQANDTPYGLAAYFYSRDVGRVFRVAEALEYGIVGANDGGPSTAQAPFGGMKQSGFGREGGKYAMHDYSEIKYISIGGLG